MDIHHGTVKFFCGHRGYGFVMSDFDKKELFFHKSIFGKSHIKALRRGDRVHFETYFEECDRIKYIDLLFLSERRPKPQEKLCRRPDDATPTPGKKSGAVKWYDARKGYGFISGDDGKEVFVHHKEIRKNGFRFLLEGERVEYGELSDGNRQVSAKDVCGPRGASVQGMV